MAPNHSAGSPETRRRWLANSLTIVAVYLLVLIPVIWEEGPRERVRWYIASAETNWSQGNQELAVPLLTRAIELSTEPGELWLRRAEWHRILGDEPASLADATQALQGTTGSERMELLMQRAELLQHMQRWQEAVNDWREIRVMSDEEESRGRTETTTLSRAQLLNGLSYARALAHIELPEALLEATEALREDENSAAILDTRGYILFLMGRREEALIDLNRAVQLQRNHLRVWQRVFEEQRQQLVDLAALRRMDELYRRALAVMLYHRGLAQEKTEPEKARRDFAQIRKELGFQPGPDLF